MHIIIIETTKRMEGKLVHQTITPKSSHGGLLFVKPVFVI